MKRDYRLREILLAPILAPIADFMDWPEFAKGMVAGAATTIAVFIMIAGALCARP